MAIYMNSILLALSRFISICSRLLMHIAQELDLIYSLICIYVNNIRETMYEGRDCQISILVYKYMHLLFLNALLGQHFVKLLKEFLFTLYITIYQIVYMVVHPRLDLVKYSIELIIKLQLPFSYFTLYHDWI